MTRRVLGVLAGNDMPLPLLAAWAASAEVLLAADGGGNRLVEAGFSPSRVVGDLDSANAATLESAADIVSLPSQDSTDCDKLLAVAQAQGYRAMTLASAEGDLPDHFLATLQSSARSEVGIRIALRRGLGWIVRASVPLELHTKPGRRLSLLPLTECQGVDLLGVHWEVSGGTMHAQGLTSISNRTIGDRVTVGIGDGAAFLFLEYTPEEMPFW